jgi:hypothetical protein
VGRQCPDTDCEEYFKITPGTGLKGAPPCHCPYCGHTGFSNAFFAREQIEYAKSVVKGKVVEALRRDLKALEFEHKPRGQFGIGVSVKFKPGAPIPNRWYRERDLETGIVCDKCSLRYTIYGVFGWCPDCGIHNSLQILLKNLELAKKKLELAASLDKELADSVIADALPGIVAAFDGFGRELCSMEDFRISFQNLEGARKNIQERFGFDIAESVTTQQWRGACRAFQKRHLIGHRIGVIDEEYLQKADDPDAVLRPKVTAAPHEVEPLIETVAEIGKRIFDGMKVGSPGP